MGRPRTGRVSSGTPEMRATARRLWRRPGNGGCSPAADMRRRWYGMPLLLLLLACGGQTSGPPTAKPVTSNDGSAYGGSFAAFAAPIGAGDDAPAPPAMPALPAMPPIPGADASSSDDASTAAADAPAPPTFDAGASGVCAQPLAPGDLRIDELMIESVAGTGDYGEWLEVESTLDCALDLRGVHGDCPRGAKVATFDISGDVWLPPRGTFVVADSTSPAINHDLPGTLIFWFGQPGDVLRNKGTTVTLRANDTVIDSLTYPALSLAVGASLAFPAGCDPSVRTDFSRWQRSVASWFPGFLGTPNAPNVDVSCPGGTKTKPERKLPRHVHFQSAQGQAAESVGRASGPQRKAGGRVEARRPWHPDAAAVSPLDARGDL